MFRINIARMKYHLVKYTQGSKQCVYIWDSVTRKVVLDTCSDNWTEAAKKAAEAMKEFLGELLNAADWWATIVIWGGLLRSSLLISLCQAILFQSYLSTRATPIINIVKSEINLKSI